MAASEASIHHPASHGRTMNASAPRPRPPKPRRTRGSVYRRGRRYWIQFYVPGEPKPRREPARTESYKAAQDLLTLRLGALAKGEPIIPRVDRITYDELAADLRLHYQTTGCRNVDEADKRFAHLTAFFAGRRAATIGQPEATTYVAHRQAEGAANGTINRELALLVRLLRLGYAAGKVFRLPVIRKLKEAPPRQGFFEAAQYEAVRSHLPPDLQVVIDIEHTFGWRTQSEVLMLERRHLDLKAGPHGTLRLDPGTTKNDDGRVVYLTPELQQALTEQLARVEVLGRQLGRVIPCLFPHFQGPLRGTRRHDFRKVWTQATHAAGCPGRLRHDFRRTAVRNLERAHVPRSIAMKITGHRTEAVYRRYAIVSDADLQAASERLARHNFRHNRPERLTDVR
jgi:Phage integrase family